MKKVLFILIVTVILFIFTIFYEKNENSKVHPSEFIHSTYEYECNDKYYDNKYCKAYFLSPLKPIYIKSFINNDNGLKEDIKFILEIFEYDNQNYIKNGNIQLYNGDILTKKLQFTYDKNLDGIYEYNNEIYTFNNGCITSTNTLSSPRPCTAVWQMDNNIFYIIEPIISEIPIYEYEFDSEKNLILYPLSATYNHMDKRLSYTLKRQN